MTEAQQRVPRWRPILAWAFLILFVLLEPVALVAGWARETVVNTDQYTRTVSGLAADPRLQEAVAQFAAARAETMLAGENPTATSTIIARGAAQAVGDAARQVLASEAFQETWESANRAAHQQLVSELAAGRGAPVTLDLSPLREEIAAAAATLGADQTALQAIEDEDYHVEVLDASTADRLRGAYGQLNTVFWASLLATLLALILSVVLAPDRLAAVGRAGFGLAIAMAALMGGIVLSQAWLVNQAAAEGGGAVVEGLLETVTQGLRVLTVALVSAGLVIAAVFTGLSALRRGAARRATL